MFPSDSKRPEDGNLASAARPVDSLTLLVTATLITSLLWMLAMDRYVASPPLAFILLDILAFFVFVLSVCTLPLIVWRGVSKRYISVMDGWWWLSVPYSIAYPAIVLVLGLQAYGHALAMFLLVYFVTILGSFAWMLVAIGNVLFRRSHLDVKQTARLGGIMLAGALLIALRAAAARP